MDNRRLEPALRCLSADEIDSVAGGATEYVYVYQNGKLYQEMYDSNTGNWIGESIVNDTAGYFACGGGGNFGLTGGMCVATNPFDLIAYGGGGTPGPSFSAGVATSTQGYLTDWSIASSATGPVGLGTTPDGSAAAVFFGKPGAGATYGVSLGNVASQGVYNTVGIISDWSYDRMGRPYDAP